MKTVVQLKRELNALRQAGTESKMERRREILSLRSNMTMVLKSIHKARSSTQLSLYGEQIHNVFGASQQQEVQENVPRNVGVAKIRAQLCEALHKDEIQLKQSHLYKRHTKHIKKYLQKEVEKLRQESRDTQEKLGKQIQDIKNSLEQQSQTMSSTIHHQEKEIATLRTQLGMTNVAMDLSLMSPETRKRSVAESLHTIMEKGSSSLEELELNQHRYKPVLDSTETPTCLSRSKIWIELKKENYLSDLNDDKDGGDNELLLQTPVDDFLLRAREKDGNQLFCKTKLGQSLIELMNSEDSMLSPTSKEIKKLSNEVFLK
mmetsp:Transcript_52375/g.126759  ORF Transcript_52375/g.126759 Transcript_52375/m.126759 type:complete len:318 (+) Transcript_52375:276-1229(+)